jgi:hypothetical protein
MRKPTQADKLKLALKCLIENDALSAREILTAMLAPAPVKPRGIAGLTVLLPHGFRRFNPDDPKAAAAADSTPCVLCKAPVKFARLALWWSPLKTARGYGHLGCVEKAENEATRIFAELDANRAVMPEFDASKAAVCLCGHGYAAHKKDELENLLNCEYPGCSCDHFRPGGTLADTGMKLDDDGNRDDSDSEFIASDCPECGVQTLIEDGDGLRCANCGNIFRDGPNGREIDHDAMARINADMIEADDREMGIAD